MATAALLLSGLAVAVPVGGWPADLANALGTAVRSAAIVDAGPQVTDQDTVAAPISRLRTVPRALVAAAPAATPVTETPLATTPPAASPAPKAAELTSSPSTAAAPSTPQRSAKPSAAANPAPKPKQASGSTTKPAGTGPAAAVVAATNAERADAGCDPLTIDSRLNSAARKHAADMAANDYFSHTDQDGGDSSDRIDAAGFTGSRTAENIANGQQSAAEVVAAWMDSSGHRRNILNCDYDRIGVGYDSRGDYWVQDFGG